MKTNQIWTTDLKTLSGQLTPLTWKRSAVAFFLIALAASLRIWPLHSLGTALVWLTFYPAVMVVAIYGGIFSGLNATGLACLIAYYGGPFLAGANFIVKPADWLGMSVFVLTGTMISCVAEAMRIAQLRAKMALNRAETANRAKSEFLAVISHEIRTPLHGILGLAHLMGQTELNDKQRGYLTNVQISGESLLSTINDILDFSKVESGQLTLESVNFNLDDVLRNLSSILSARAAEKKLRLTIQTMPDVPRLLKGDGSRLGQVLLNLVGNAIKFTDAGEVNLKISLRDKTPETASLEFSIRDTGIGITSEQMERLFQPFQQADYSTSRKYGGTGLGLVISQRMVKLMGGKIHAVSQFGKGSTFAFTINPSRPPETPEGIQIIYPELGGKHILLVDEDPETKETVEKALGSLCRLSLAETIAAAQEICEKADEPPAMVILRWRLTQTGQGNEDWNTTGAQITWRGIPAILLSAPEEQRAPAPCLVTPLTREALFESILLAARQDYLLKPGQIHRQISQPLVEGLIGGRILVVEDNKINQTIALEILQQLGLNVALADSGEEAVEKAAQFDYNAILMDIQMPGMDGYQATAAIRKNSAPNGRRIPIIAMTAHAMEGNRQQALDADMDDYIAKPVNVEQLTRVLARWVKVVHPAGPEKEPETMDFSGRQDVVDSRGALERLGGNQKLYLRLLSMFETEQNNSREDIREALKSGNLSLAVRLTHTLKGVAGTIGAMRLSDSARELEHALASRHNEEIEQKLRRVKDEMALVIAFIREKMQKG